MNKSLVHRQRAVLVAESRGEIKRLLAAKLTREGFRVIQAANGREALIILGKESADLALLNMIMPQLDGLQMVKKLRAMGSKIPVILYSIKTRESDMHQALEAGASDYMVQPFSLSDLVLRITRLLGEG